MSFKGKFIVFEGGEGSGKTTQVRRLARKLQDKGYQVVSTHEPGGTEIGGKIREVLLYSKEKFSGLTELFLYCADRADHIEKVLKPALEEGKIVLCDRFSGSTFTYQCYGRQILDLEKVKSIEQHSRNGLKPDLVIYLDLKPEIGLKRVNNDVKQGARTELTRFEKDKADFYQRVRRGFLELAEENDWRWEIIDGNRSKEHIERQIWKSVEKILERREAYAG